MLGVHRQQLGREKHSHHRRGTSCLQDNLDTSANLSVRCNT